jgi:pimeloyl-ACP methyl ester carboxylesterase
VANLIFGLGMIPVLGETVMRFRNRMVERPIFEGGVAEPDAIPAPLLEELYLVGTRPGHYRAFLNLLRNAHKWDEAHTRYADIRTAVLLVYGERDWSKPNERETTLHDIPGAKMHTVAGGSHFLSLDRPREVEELITEFAAT